MIWRKGKKNSIKGNCYFILYINKVFVEENVCYFI